MVAPMRYALLVGASAFVGGQLVACSAPEAADTSSSTKGETTTARLFSLRSFALPIWRSMFQALKVRRH
ncbi:hypothetical protein [Shewanella vaxholmensis]|uniref:hypothetical protein n=1 Tax=Shewanella vaxholmensis TaxID=3063535 RepID=UPI00353030CB